MYFNEENDLVPYHKNEIVPLENNINNENSNELNEAYQNQYGLAQVYNNSIREILKTVQGEEIPIQKQQEILALVDEWKKVSEEYADKDKSRLNDKDKLDFQSFINNLNKSIKVISDTLGDIFKIGKSIVNGVASTAKVFRKSVFDVLDNTFDVFDSVLSAKLPNSLIMALAFANPLTSIVYSNSDLASKTVKSTYKALKSVTGNS